MSAFLLRRLRRGAFLVAASGASQLFAGAAVAQTEEQVTPDVGEREPNESAPAMAREDRHERSRRDIIVNGKRYGAADMAPIFEIDADQVDAYAADTIQQLLSFLKQQIGGTDSPLAMLVNGRRVAQPRQVSSYPPEAIQRIEVLPPEAAARYGFPPEQRVVNLVLRQQFGAITTDARAERATAGGRPTEQLSADHIEISGDVRSSIQLNYSRQAALLESERVIPRAGLFDPVGNIQGLLPGGEIDPMLSALAGGQVLVAGVPAGAATTAPTLGDFAALANHPNTSDVGRFRSLMPAGHTLAIGGDLARPIGKGNLSLGVNVTFSGTTALLGLPQASLLLPAASSWSPFGTDVLLSRALLGDGALQRQDYGTSMQLTAGYFGKVGRWMLEAESTYNRSRSSSRLDLGTDIAPLQARIDANDPVFNPFGPLPSGQQRFRLTQSHSDAFTMRLGLSGKLAQLPSGQVSSFFNANFSRSNSGSQIDGFSSPIGDATRTFGDLRWMLSIPLAGKDGKLLPIPGIMGISLVPGVHFAEGHTSSRFTLNGNWFPIPSVNIGLTLARDNEAVNADMRQAPIVTTPNMRVYDFTRGELVEVTSITGGNPDLRDGSNQSLIVNGRWQPQFYQALALSLDYQRRSTSGGAMALPPLTPDVEAAFPERVTRDSAGRLIALDTRPVGIDRTESSSLRLTGFWMFPAPRIPLPGAPGNPRPPLARPRTHMQATLSYTWQLSDEVALARGGLLIDRLSGFGGGGLPRHGLEFRTMVDHGGFALQWIGHWQGQRAIRSRSAPQGAASDLFFSPKLTMGGRFDVDLGRLAGGPNYKGWMRRLRLSLDTDNLFDARQIVHDGLGNVPQGYSRDELDPLGRVVRIVLRKQF